MIATMKDIAKMAGVSPSTVSRCLNNSTLIPEETKVRVRAIATGMGFQFNVHARSLTTRKTDTIGLILSGSHIGGHKFDIHHHLWQDALMLEFQKRGYSVLVQYVTPETGEIRSHIEFCVQSRRIDAFIIMLAQITKEAAALLDSTHLPYLFLKYLPDTCAKDQVRHVVPDQESGGRLVGEYLLSLGHREIFCLSAGIPGGEFVQRTRGFSNALRAGGVVLPETRICYGDASYHSGADVVRRYLHVIRETTALFAQTDMMALGAIAELKNAGLLVPDDISVIGYDNIEPGVYSRPYLTTVEQNVPLAVEAACELLCAVINDENAPVTSVRTKPKLIVRDSCAPVARGAYESYHGNRTED